MSKYTSGVHRREVKPSTEPHPVWRTLGCLMLILVPAMSIALAVGTVQWGLGGGWPVPPEFLRPLYLPDWIYYMPGLAALLTKIVSIDYLLAYTIFTAVYLVVLAGVVSLLYAILHRMTAPSRLGPLDVEPIKARDVKYRR